MVALALVPILVLAVVVAAVMLTRAIRGLLEQRFGGIEERLGGIEDRVHNRLEGLDTRLLSAQQSTGQQTTQIVEKLARVEGTTAQMLEKAADLSRLEQLLRPPKARGGFGELLLENLLRDRLPPSAYEVQHTFKSGERVDAVIRIEKLVPIDSKFPLDNFERMIDADEEAQQALFEKAFARDVKGHIDVIAAKYIRPAEGTYDFAFMYLPVEAIYYELACGKTGALLRYAHDRRVFPVSPTTFTAYLQVIAFGLKGLEFEQHAHEVMAYVADLRKDFGRFREDFEVVGTHLEHAQKRYVSAEKRLDRFDTKLERASEQEALDAAADEEPPLAIEAA